MTTEEKNKWIVENVLKECWHEALEKHLPLGRKPICKNCNTQLGDNWDRWNPDFYTSDPDTQAINFFRLWRAIGGIRSKMKFENCLYDGNPCASLADTIGIYFDWRKKE